MDFEEFATEMKKKINKNIEINVSARIQGGSSSKIAVSFGREMET